MRWLIPIVAIALVAGPALAVTPGTDVWIPSVGRGQGACVDSICSQWRTDVWIYNPSSTGSVTVTIAFLTRGVSNTSPTTETVTVVAGETAELDEILYTLFGFPAASGALHFTAATPIVVTSRIYDANVVTQKGTGSAGQFFGGMLAQQAISLSESTSLVGLTQDSADEHRANFGFLETSGSSVDVMVTEVDDSGSTLASKSYSLDAYEPQQYSITDVGGPLGSNYRLLVTVTGGTGTVLAFASQVDNRTGDPSTVEMVTTLATGTFDGAVWDSDSLYVGGGIELIIDGSGLTYYEGVADIPCGGGLSYVLDFYTDPDAPTQVTPIADDGSFSTQVSYDYYDGTTLLFTTEWTLSGTVTPSGVISGTLRSDTSGGTGDNAGCNIVVDRPWKAGWTGNA